MPRYSALGLSLYTSNFDTIKDQLSAPHSAETLVFTSLHIAEEMDDGYITRVKEMLSFLKEQDYRIIADVSARSLKIFDVETLEELKEKLNLDILRIDYGFSEKEIAEYSKNNPVGINASLITKDNINIFKENAKEVYAMHNFYPRPETGLDNKQFKKLNDLITNEGIKTLAFIAGDKIKREPIYEGLPTLEAHRYISPYAAFIDLYINYNVDYVFVGDGVITDAEREYINLFVKEKVFTIPVILNENYIKLDAMEYTIRGDSPKSILRLQESREYATFGRHIEQGNVKERLKGSVTIDNYLYKRYSGEIQILKKNFPQDDKVNVIAHVPKRYHLLLQNINNYSKIRFKAIKK